MFELRKDIYLYNALCLYGDYVKRFGYELEFYSTCNTYQFFGEVNKLIDKRRAEEDENQLVSDDSKHDAYASLSNSDV